MAAGSTSDQREVAAFLRAHREELIARWRERVLADPLVPEANRLQEPALRDHVPALIDDLAECISSSSPRSTQPPPDQTTEASIGHAHHRHALGYTLDEALREWSHFRAAVMELIRAYGVELSVEGRALIHATIDQSMSDVALAMHQAATSALTKSESGFARQAAELEAVVQSIADGVFIADTEGVHHANRPALELLGVSSIDGLRNNPGWADDLMPRDPSTGEPIAARDRGVAAAMRGESTVRDVLVRHQTLGRDIVVRAAAAPVRIDERIIATVTLTTDVTEERRVASRLREEGMFRERFLGIVGHDLRNPLASITLSAQTLLRQELPESHAQLVGRIHAASTRMNGMIDTLLDLTRSRLGAGIPIDPRPMDLAECATKVVDEFRGSHPQRAIEMRVDGDLRGTWDAQRMAQVLTNLIGNAVQHGHADSPVTLKMSPGDPASLVRIEVQNRSAPISPEHVARIFDPFERAPTTRKDAGLGLGLFIVREIVRAHGGTVAVMSANGMTTFSINLPRGSSG